MTRKRDGRTAIEFLKEQYLAGRSFANTAAIERALVSEAKVRAGKIKQTAVMDWDRQARNELYATYFYVTPPTQPVGYGRTPNANADLRAKAVKTRKRYLHTAIKNLTLIQAAAAAQVDATRLEIQDETELRMAVRLLESIRDRMESA